MSFTHRFEPLNLNDIYDEDVACVEDCEYADGDCVAAGHCLQEDYE